MILGVILGAGTRFSIGLRRVSTLVAETISGSKVTVNTFTIKCSM